jgi:Fe-S-cluster containining protein
MNTGARSIEIDGWQIDKSLLEVKTIQRCHIRTCQAGCCADGVWVDILQAQAILDHAEMIAPHMPLERRDPETWFAERYDDDPSFPSGSYIGTTTLPDTTHPGGSTCVFLRPEDRYCAIQAASMAHGDAAWELKPLYCCLFPVMDELRDGKRYLLLDAENSLFEHGGGCYEDCVTPQPVFQVYAEETAFALGLEGYRKLCAQVGETPRL